MSTAQRIRRRIAFAVVTLAAAGGMGTSAIVVSHSWVSAPALSDFCSSGHCQGSPTADMQIPTNPGAPQR